MKPNTFIIDDKHTYYVKDDTAFYLITTYVIELDTLLYILRHNPVYNNPENQYVLDSHKIKFIDTMDFRYPILTHYIPKGTGQFAAKIMQYLGVYINRNPTIPLQKQLLLGDPYPKYKTGRHRRPIFMRGT
jgi:hypothetical protein